MPSKGKGKNAAAAHQHDKRHESGLAAPGKRVIRQRSNHNLQQQQSNGHINGKTNGQPNPPAQPSSSTGTDYSYDIARPATEAPRPAPVSTNSHPHHIAFGDVVERDRTNSDASMDGMEVYDGAEEGQHVSMAYAEMDGRRQSGARKSTLGVVSTILAYYPLRDAISILILLLSLPATLVLVIQTLFASLTFVPPTAGISIPSIKELFNASSLGYPALATILVVDLIFYLCWLPIWKPVQGMLLDLSQAVIAVSLSGATTRDNGPTYSILSCSAVVCIVHVLRYRAIHLTAFDYLRSILAKLEIGIDLSVLSPLSATSFLHSAPVQNHGWLYTAVRTILGIHIVSQGVTTCIRRSLASANERSNHVPAITKSEPDLANHESNRSSNSGTPDPSQHQSVSMDRVGSRDGKARESSSKRRRKQANEVRSKQPLWAAIASTKVTFVKEMEQRSSNNDSKEALAMDGSKSIAEWAGLSTSKATKARLWLEEVRDTEIFFRADLSPLVIAEFDGYRETISAAAGIDKTRPFYIRINGASWSSAKIYPAYNDDRTKQLGWHGEIFGLAPMSSYLCEIVSMAKHEVLCSSSLITQSARTAEQVPIIVAPTQPQSLRPSSPTTTLRKSIEQASASLLETKNKTKKTKKDQRAAYSDIRKEINQLKSKLENSGGLDDRQARRLQQITQHKNQADEAAVQIAKQVQDMGEIPDDEINASDAIRRDWQRVNNAKAAAITESDKSRIEMERESRDIRTEIAAAESKREKLHARSEQRKDELSQAAAKQLAEASARQKHNHERAMRRKEHESTETQLRFHISKMGSEAEILDAKAVEAYQQGQSLYSTWPSSHQNYSSPPTPDDMLPHQESNGFSNFPQAFVPYAQQHHLQQNGPRGRSSSMLSQYSGFTDAEEQPFEMRHHSTWPHHKHLNGIANDDRKESEASSGSSGTNGSTASSSPRPDARVFVPGVKIGPIGPPTRNKTSSPQTPEVAIASPSPPPQ